MYQYFHFGFVVSLGAFSQFLFEIWLLPFSTEADLKIDSFSALNLEVFTIDIYFILAICSRDEVTS